MRAEVRGRNRHWRVHYQDPAGIASPVPAYDKDGNLKEVLMVGAPSGKLVESYAEFSSQEEAVEYARWLGCEEVIVKKTLTKGQSLAKARAAKSRQEGDVE